MVQAEMTTFSAEARIPAVRLAEDFPAAEVPSEAVALQEAFRRMFMRVFDFDNTIYDGESGMDLFLYFFKKDPKGSQIF